MPVGISNDGAVGHELRHRPGAQEVVLHGVHRDPDAGVGERAHVPRPSAGRVDEVIALDEALVRADTRDGALFRNHFLHLAVRYEGNTALLDIQSMLTLALTSLQFSPFNQFSHRGQSLD